MRIREMLAVVAIAGMLGCEGGEALLPLAEGDGITFRYAGAASGSHESVGEVRVGGDGFPAAGDWAIARPDSLGGLVIAGFESTGESTGNLFVLQIPDQEARQYTCTLHGTDGGCHGSLFLGVDLEDPAAAGEVFQVVSGSATIAELGSGRLRGSFTLELREGGEGGATLQVSEGELDLEFDDDVTLANGIACLARNLMEGTNERCL